MTDTGSGGAPNGAGGGGAPNGASGGGQGYGGGGGEWDGLEPDVRSAIEAKGYKTRGDVAKAYINLEKVIGYDKLPLPPKDAATGSRDFSKWDGWSQLGRPEKPEYKFTDPEGYQPSDMDTQLRGVLAPAFHKAGLSQWQVDTILGPFNEFTGGTAKDMQAGIVQRAERAHDELRTAFGAAFDAKLDLANRFIRNSGGDKLVASLKAHGILSQDGAVLDPQIAIAFANAGEAMAEDGALPGGKPATSGAVMAPAQAKAEIDRIYGEALTNPKHPYNDARHPEHEALHERLNSLFTMANPEDAKGQART